LLLVALVFLYAAVPLTSVIDAEKAAAGNEYKKPDGGKSTESNKITLIN